tara:strand:- start:229 stop:603 length:375 start_codon:yes stop_codon:yes gene_type:complete
MGSRCVLCNGKLVRRLDEIACLSCGKIQYVASTNINETFSKKTKNEWVRGINRDVFQVEYEIVHQTQTKAIPEKGVYSGQPYAFCLKINGPTGVLKMTVAREKLRQNFYQSTGLRLKYLEEAIG